MDEAETIAKAIYEGRNGPGCLPRVRLPASHKAPYLHDAKVAARAMLQVHFPRMMREEPMTATAVAKIMGF